MRVVRGGMPYNIVGIYLFRERHTLKQVSPIMECLNKETHSYTYISICCMYVETHLYTYIVCMLCNVVLWYVMLYVMICYVMCYVICYDMLCYVMLCYVMLCYVMLCYVMLCYVMLCYVMLKTVKILILLSTNQIIKGLKQSTRTRTN